MAYASPGVFLASGSHGILGDPYFEGMELSERLGLDKIELVQEDTGSRLLSLIDDHFNANLSPETPLTDSALSSLDRIELAIRIEEEFGVRIDERVYEKCATVGELAEYLEEHSEEA